MKIAIKNPAPRGVNLERWGDFHFGKSLEAALVRQGAEVVQHFWPDWDLYEGEDAAVWIRGKRRCSPRPDVINAIWVLSHPSALTTTELNGFDIVYAASSKLASELHELGVSGVELMRQCTDHHIFHPRSALSDDDRKGLLFVASSRGVRRPILDWSLAAGLKPTLVGQGWPQLGLGDLAQLDYVDNSHLPALYAAARYGMNDHWGDMAYYQMINNRTFDCLACGLPVISDGFPELREVAGNGVWIVDGPESFRDAYWSMRLDYDGARKACKALWERIGAQHTFDARAKTIIDDLHAGAVSRPGVIEVVAVQSTAHAIASLLKAVGGTGSDPTKIKLSLLHVMPHRETSGALSAIPSLSTISAGIGVGPWNVSLEDGHDELGRRKFDVIFVEDGWQWAQADRPHELLGGLVKRLKPGGLISAFVGELLHPLYEDGRLAAISQEPLVFRRTVEHLDHLCNLPT